MKPTRQGSQTLIKRLVLPPFVIVGLFLMIGGMAMLARTFRALRGANRNQQANRLQVLKQHRNHGGQAQSSQPASAVLANQLLRPIRSEQLCIQQQLRQHRNVEQYEQYGSIPGAVCTSVNTNATTYPCVQYTRRQPHRLERRRFLRVHRQSILGGLAD